MQQLVQGVLAVVYLLSFVMFISWTVSSTGTQHKFHIGAPSPWFVDEVNATGAEFGIRLFSWAYVVAAIGLAALALSRRFERIDHGRVHSMRWHYGAWIVTLALIFGLGVVSRVAHHVKPQRKATAASSGQSTVPESLLRRRR